MRERQRVASREYMSGHDKEENPVRLPNAKPSWRRSLRHVIVASLSSFLYGYHIGVVNETLESISIDLGFSGNTMAEGLVVSICLGGAFIGSLFSGWIADGVGRRRSFQLCALPMIIGAGMSATAKTLWGMLLGRLFVGTGMGLGPPVAALYVAEVSPPAVRGTFGGLTQIATCLGLMGALFIGIPAKEIVGWWRICFWVSVIPATILAIFMEICAESPHWLFKRMTSVVDAERDKYNMINFEEAEFRVGLPSRFANDHGESSRKSSGEERGFSETANVDMKLNLSSGNNLGSASVSPSTVAAP